MHSALQELRLTQRALRSSCRHCSACCQSPRRAFHRGLPVRNSQEPGNNAGSGAAPGSNDSKNDLDNKPPVAPSSAPSNFPYLPPPAVRQGSSAPSSEQPVAASFYGSSWNRRQRMRAQQEPPEPPFVAPQWFYDHNATLWGEGRLAADVDNWLRVLDEHEAERLARDSYYDEPTIGGAPPAAGRPEDKRDASGVETSQRHEWGPHDGSETPQGSMAEDFDSIPDLEPVYWIGANQWDEVLTTTRGLLRAPASQQPHGDPAALASNLVLHYAGKNGDYLLDEVVHNLASQTGSDLLTLDVQDVADLISHAGSVSKDPSAMEGRMLSYDILTKVYSPEQSSSTEKDTDTADEEDGLDEADAFDMPSMPGAPGLGGNAGQPMLVGKPFTFTIDLRNSFDGQKGRGTQPPSALSQLFSNRSSGSPAYGQNFLQSSSIPFRNVVENLLSVLPSKRLSASASTKHSRQKFAEEHSLPQLSTIIHVKDVKSIQNVLVGSQFLSSLYNLVQNRRENGESIMIIGTEEGNDPAEYSSTKIDSVQRTPDVGEISRTIVISPLERNSDATSTLEEDRKRRVAMINLRHVWEMMRGLSTPNFLGLEPGFWNRKDVYEGLWHRDQAKLTDHVWSFQYIHRLATYIRGIPDPQSFVAKNDQWLTADTVMPLISNVDRKLQLSDSTKALWADIVVKRKAAAARGRALKRQKRPTDIEQQRLEVESKLAKARSNASKHEKRLLGGVIEASKISTTFKDVHAPAETIDALQTLTTLSLIRPEAFTYGVLASDKIPGLLLYGPPGTGKTLLAKAVARESGATMLEVSAADLNDMYVGEGEKNVKALFSLARKLSPCVVFLDEADAMFSARSANGRRVSHRELLNQFLKEWDGMSNDAGSAFLMVATNRPMDFDDAVLRRLPRRLLVDLPTEIDRHAILQIHLKSESLAADVDLADLAKKTPFYSGSDLKNLCVAAALNAVRGENTIAKESGSQSYKHPAKRTLTAEHFGKALDEITASVSEDMNSLKEIKKFDDIYGDKKGRKRRQPRWGFRTAKEAEETLDTLKVRA